MKQTTLFVACGATLVFSAIVLLRNALTKAAPIGSEDATDCLFNADLRTGNPHGESDAWSQQDDDFSPDAFRDELLK